MSDIYEYADFVQKDSKQPVCRVAYTLNNEQPVACTIIGEQPLFYMDYEEAVDDSHGVFDTSLVDTEFDAATFSYSDDDFFTEEDLHMLKNEMNNLKDQIKSYETFSSEFIESDNAVMERFQENIFSCIQKQPIIHTQKIKSVIEILAQSRLAQSYIDFAESNNVVISFSSQVEQAEYNRKSKTIFINPDQDEANLVLSLVAELRCHWQHANGALIDPLMFHPDQAILVNRAQTADLTIAIVRIAWELQLSGYKAGWERLENSSMADLARAFAREAFLDFRTINNGEAAAAVFEAWFLSERCRSQDKALIQNMLADTQGFVFGLDEVSKNVTPDLIAALGTMPYGKNYLSSHVETIINDAIFTNVRDRSNANFLWFIKFERTFHETEQALQSDKEQSAFDIHQDAQKNISNGTKNNEQTAILLSFPGNATGRAPTKKVGSKLNKPTTEIQTSADIVYLRRWSSE